MATIEEQFKVNADKNTASINSMYDNSQKTNNQTLQAAFNAGSAAQNTQQQTSQQAFNQGAYDVGVQNDRNARNVTQFADVRDVNTGLGSQHQLNLRNARANSTGSIAFAQQQALQESQRQAAMQEEMYRQRVSQALADNDYKRAAALMDEKNRAQANNEANAKIAASFGDFGGMNAIYGAETAGKMQTMWNAQHPEEAYRLGRIDADTYKNITGSYPAGYTPPSVGGGYGGYYGPADGSRVKASITGALTKTTDPKNTKGLTFTGTSKDGYIPQQKLSIDAQRHMVSDQLYGNGKSGAKR